ncbi:hypothetical protein NIASO_19545 [Niabella soli DSM 19437]|uniref:Uncharacterized protein n=1 Tax=Niabella soli DSM 19437 TaxID=929713 RepID=W0F9I4_9BACT|nr:hypothetical protein NIASO_19545 [Niabella soli DSM 19437]
MWINCTRYNVFKTNNLYYFYALNSSFAHLLSTLKAHICTFVLLFPVFYSLKPFAVLVFTGF